MVTLVKQIVYSDKDVLLHAAFSRVRLEAVGIMSITEPKTYPALCIYHVDHNGYLHTEFLELNEIEELSQKLEKAKYSNNTH